MKRLLGLGSIAGLIALVALAPGTARASGGQGGGCIAHRPAYVEDVFESHYTAGCSGHDEPELDPVSAVPGSAKDITWTAVLPSNGSFFPVDAVGPTFWFGGTVNDPNSLFGQAFEELQFYPNALVSNCTPNGGFVVSNVPGDYTVCSPVWTIHTTGQKPNFHEPAAFNAMLTNGSSNAPLVMHAGDTIQVHYFVTAAKDGWHINVQDLTTGQSGTIVLNSKSDGPLMPAYDTQTIGNSLKWGAVHDTPDSFVWEIGHTSPFTSPAQPVLLAGRGGLLLVRRGRMAQPVAADPHPQRHLRGRLASPLVGGRVRLRRQGRGARPDRDRLHLHVLRRPLLHLPLVHAERRRVVQLRRRLPDHRARLR